MINQDLLFGSLTGILESDSPSSKALILTYLDEKALDLLSQSYITSVNNGVLRERKIKRDPKVRFNPKPARILHILISEAQCFEIQKLEAAILDCSDEEICSLKFLSSLDKQSFQKSPYLAALLLDELRHLHLSSDKTDPNLLNQIQKLEELKNIDSFAHWSRLNLLISTALLRASKLVKP